MVFGVRLAAVAMLLTTTSITTCDFLSYKNQKLADVPTREYRSNCTQLDISNNSIRVLSDDSFRYFPQLITLWAQFNNISNLSEGAFEPTKMLTVVYLSNNRLRHIPKELFKTNKQKLKLYLHNNNVILPSTGSFLMAPELVNLDLSSCNISALPIEAFTGTPKLKFLDLSQNKLKDLSGVVFQPLKSLMRMDISHNNVSTLTFLAKLTRPILTLYAFNTSIVTLSSDELHYVNTLLKLNMTANVCCCDDDCQTNALLLSGRNWQERCTKCPHVGHGADHFSKETQTSTQFTVSTDVSETPRTDEPNRQHPLVVTTERMTTEAEGKIFVKEPNESILVSPREVEVKSSDEGNLTVPFYVVLVLFLLVVLGLGVVAVVIRLRKRRRPPHNPYSCPYRSMMVQHGLYEPSDTSEGALHHPEMFLATAVAQNHGPRRKVQVTDLDNDDVCECAYTINNIYERVDD